MKIHLAVEIMLLVVVTSCHAARILGVVPTSSISHQLPFRLIALELARRGHEVTVITTDPIKKPIKNYTEIDISFEYADKSSYFGGISMVEWSALHLIDMAADASIVSCERQLGSQQMKDLLKTKQTFDVMILERTMYPCYYGLAHMVGSPILVGYISMSPVSPVISSYGNPDNPAYIPQWFVPYTDHMSFWQRLHNAYVQLYYNYMHHYKIMPVHEEIQRKYFGPNVPSVYEVETNFSLLLMNNHFSVSYPRPNLPSIVELTGLHIETERKPLPKDLQKWLDDAKDGVVYFSLGSNVRSSTMPEDKLKSLLSAFSRLPQKVLWKWETDTLPGQPDNVKVGKWLPQQDILAHPNVRVFIFQGGLQSFNEAVYHAVPLIGIPIFADQPHIIAKVVQAGVGVKVDYHDITEESIYNAVRTILEEERYSSNMRRLSAVFREHQAESLPRAVWWVEYVIRHSGARHLRSAALDLAWWQLLLLDVLLAVAVAITTILIALYAVSRLLLRSLGFLSRTKDKQQ